MDIRAAEHRITKELVLSTNNPCAGITVTLVDGTTLPDGPFESLTAQRQAYVEFSGRCARLPVLEWKAEIAGEVGTPHEGGIYRMNVTFPRDYPAAWVRRQPGCVHA